jgi:dipeptidyl aminopeptidase/acylaminoacyl peptidase
MDVNLIEKIELGESEDPFSKYFKEEVANIKSDTIKLENGSEAYFVRWGSLGNDKKHPMVVYIHGGPFGTSPSEAFLMERNYLMS